MNVTVETTGPCRRALKVEYTAEEIQKEYDDSLAVYAKHGQVKGFRTGRAPLEMIRRKYDPQILENLRDHLLARGFRQAMQEHKFEPLAEMDLQQSPLKADQPFSFSVTLDVEPEFDLPAYKGLEVEAQKVEISEEAVTQALDRYLENAGKYEDQAADQPAREGDMVAVDYSAAVDGRPMAELSEKAKSLAVAHDFFVIANEEYSFLPGFGPQLVGLKVGDTKEISVAFDAQAPIEELRGKTGVFTATVKKIRVRTPAPLDAALFKSLGVEDEAGLRDIFRGVLAREAESQERARRRDQLVSALLKSATLEVPESLAHDESHRIVYDMVSENVRRGVPEQAIRDNLDKISDSAKGAARERLKLRYLLKRIAREEQIAVADAEVIALMNAQAERAGHRSIKDWLQAAKLKEKDVRAGLRQDLLTAKTIDFLLANATWSGPGADEAQKEGTKA